jgi:hypothetical protein
MIRPALMVLFLALPASAFAAAGKAIFVLGKAHVETAKGDRQVLRKGSEVESADTIVTTKRGQVQLRMSDGSLIAVRPNSRFIIENFKYDKNTETDKSVYSLVKGGFRSITGQIGKQNKSAYGVKTVVGTIGIRGTDFSARLCDTGCNGADSGLYVSVMQGGVTLSNDGGEVNIDPGEYGFMQDQNSQPMYLESAPSNLLFANTDAAQAEEQTAQDTERATINNSSATTTDSSTGSSTSIAEITPEILTPLQTENGDDLLLMTDERDFEPTLALPSTGTANYSLASETSNLGFLTSLTLEVDFAAASVGTDLSGSSGSQTWNASGTGNIDSTGSLSGAFNNASQMIDSTPFTGGTFAATGTFTGQLTLQSDASAPADGTYHYDLSTGAETATGDATLNLQ